MNTNPSKNFYDDNRDVPPGTLGALGVTRGSLPVASVQFLDNTWSARAMRFREIGRTDLAGLCQTFLCELRTELGLSIKRQPEENEKS